MASALQVVGILGVFVGLVVAFGVGGVILTGGLGLLGAGLALER